MSDKLDFKIRDFKGRQYLEYFKGIILKLGNDYDMSKQYSLAFGDYVLSSKYNQELNVLISCDKYLGYTSINKITSCFNNTDCYFFCDKFALVGPYLTKSYLAFDNLIGLLNATEDKTIILVNLNMSCNCLINLLESNEIDIKLYWNSVI